MQVYPGPHKTISTHSLPGMVAHDFNPSTQEAGPGRSFEFEASLVYRVSSSPARPYLKKQKINSYSGSKLN